MTDVKCSAEFKETIPVRLMRETDDDPAWEDWVTVYRCDRAPHEGGDHRGNAVIDPWRTSTYMTWPVAGHEPPR